MRRSLHDLFTTTVPIMKACWPQWYRNVPVLLKVCATLLPVGRSFDAMNALVSLKTVWMSLSLLVHRTVVPGATTIVLGVKA